MKVIVVGPDRGLAAALDGLGVETIRIEAPATGSGLSESGVTTADVLLLTDVAEATAVPIAKDLNPDLRVIIYSPDTMPEFVRGQVDFAVSPTVFPPGVLAEELADQSPPAVE